MTFVKSRQYREFEYANFGLSIDPSYDDRDFFAFKAGSKHYNNVKVGFTNGRKAKKVG